MPSAEHRPSSSDQQRQEDDRPRRHVRRRTPAARAKTPNEIAMSTSAPPIDGRRDEQAREVDLGQQVLLVDQRHPAVR